MNTRRGLFGLIAGVAAVAVAPFKVKAEVARCAKTDSRVLGSLRGYRVEERLDYMTAREIQSMRDHVQNIMRAHAEAYQDLQQSKVINHIREWSEDKPHYERVKGEMAQLIGDHHIPILPDGRANLDKAYEMALSQLPATHPSA